MKITTLRIGVAMLALFAWQRPAVAQQAPVPIAYGAPTVVNFTERANFEKANPPKLKRQRFVEQGEDRERPVLFNSPVPDNAEVFKFKPDNGTRAASPAPTVTFNGVMDNGTLIPPDIRGAAGPNHVMQTTNQEFRIYTKAGSLVSTVNITNFFSGSGGSGFFDPHIAYDPTAGRWMVAIDGNVANGDGGIFLAVSQTSDPTGNWYRFGIDGIGNASDFLDYPLLGFNANWIVVTGNDYLTSSNVGKIYVFNKANLYAGLSGYVNTFTSTQSSLIAPATTYDASVTTEYMVANWNGNSSGAGYVKLYTLTGTPDAPVFNSGSTVGVNQPWNGTSINAPQNGSTRLIEDGDTRIGNAVYINGSLWFTHTVFLSTPSRSAVDWWQVNPTAASVMQFGRIDNSPAYNYYPSIAVNANNDVLIGYNQSSTTAYIGAKYSFRAGTDPVNTLEDPNLFKAGIAPYYKTYGGNRNRWGDYSGTAFDPTDGSFFTFQEWPNTSNNWATVIARVPGAVVAPACAAPNGTSTSAVNYTSATFGWTGVAGAQGYNVRYRAIGAANWSTVSAATNAYHATGLTAGTNYEWQVQTVCDATTSSSFTTSTNFTTTNANAPCNAPTGMNTSAVTNTSATFNWTAVSGAVGYNVQYRAIGAANWTSGSSVANAFSVSGLTANSSYEWQVQTQCTSNGPSPFTASTNFSTTNTAPCTETYEANNSKNSAAAIPSNTDVSSQISTSSDVDWYSFTATSAQPKIKITLTNLPADYDVRLYNSGGSTQLGISQNTGTTSETIIRNATAGASYKIKVYGYGGAFSASQCYTLRVNTSGTSFAPEANEAVSAASDKVDVGLYPNPTSDDVNVSFNSDEDGRATINVYDMLGKLVTTMNSTVTAGSNALVLSTSRLDRGVYVVEVNNNGETTRGKLTVAR